VGEWQRAIGVTSAAYSCNLLSFPWLARRTFNAYRLGFVGRRWGNLDRSHAVLLGEGRRPGRSASRATQSKPPDDRGLWPAMSNASLGPAIWALSSPRRCGLEYFDEGRPRSLRFNTRSQAELWFEAILKARLEWFDRAGTCITGRSTASCANA